MDWAFAIERHRSALSTIVTGLVAMAGLAAGITADRMPRTLYRAVLAILRPAESAVRRLIVVVAHGLQVEQVAPRSFPAGLTRSGKAARAPRFQLFDRRKRFDLTPRRYFKPGRGPRITFFDDDPNDPRVPFFRPPVIKVIELAPARAGDDTVSAASLCRRLAAVKAALEDLPKQARRLARWRARRAQMAAPKFDDPLRPGLPPGNRKRRRHEVDDLLRDCHWLARERTRPDTS